MRGNGEHYDLGEMVPVASIHTARPYDDVEEIVRRILIEHGARIEVNQDDWTVTFPEGTTRVEIWPRADSTRFRIIFPDQYHIYETVTRYGVSILRYPSGEFPQELLRKYGKF
ncbi:hypothetical protein [Dictyobacter kobayashii]|uniref:Uncharacterized protein n=1 Tax=Dictyobacter kobayashii TaxID=2014872 RepID=A0A402ACD4_9CHLR|nr:hypothetical protein [Dictyobacter kobayashii]GCE16746.1 hypothetical protein KDK_05460 [Dictyobacter kobayashii]